LTGDALVGNVLANSAFQNDRKVVALYADHIPAATEDTMISVDDLFDYGKAVADSQLFMSDAEVDSAEEDSAEEAEADFDETGMGFR
jgi:hypothetical protein